MIGIGDDIIIIIISLAAAAAFIGWARAKIKCRKAEKALSEALDKLSRCENASEEGQNHEVI